MTNITKGTKNKVVDTGVFLVLVEIIFGNGVVARLVNNNESIDWNGNTYLSFGFTIDEIQEEPGNVPSVTLSVPNTNQMMEQYVLEYDAYLKSNPGTNPIAVRIDVINTAALSEGSEATYHLEVGSYALNEEYAVFELVGDNPLSFYVPKNTYRANVCRWAFKSVECGYQGPDTTCDKTYQDCKLHAATTTDPSFVSANFGGFPAINQEISSYVTL